MLQTGLCECFPLSLPLQGVAGALKTFDPDYIRGLVSVLGAFLKLPGWTDRDLTAPRWRSIISRATMVQLSQFTSMTCRGIVVAATIANRLVRLNGRMWKPLVRTRKPDRESFVIHWRTFSSLNASTESRINVVL